MGFMKEFVLPFFLFSIIEFLGRTWRIRIKGKFPPSGIFLFYHGEMLPLLYAFKKRKIYVLVRNSPDGRLAGRVAELMGYSPVFSARDYSPLAIAVDGPKGPRGVIRPRLLRWLEERGEKVFFFRAYPSRGFILPTWDRFIIPLPFSVVEIEITPFELAFEEIKKRSSREIMRSSRYT